MEKIPKHLIPKWTQNPAGFDWRDGLLAGNGDIGVLSYAPSHWEMVINKVDIFDPTVVPTRMMSHKDVMERLDKMERPNTLFLDEVEGPFHDLRQSISAVIMRLKFWTGFGWGAPAMPAAIQNLDLYNGILHVQLDAHNLHPRISMFVSRQYNVICIKLTEEKAPLRHHVFELLRPSDERLDWPVWREEEGTWVMTQTLPGGKEMYAAAIAVQCKGEKQISNHKQFSVMHQFGDAEIYVAVKSSISCPEPMAEAVRCARQAADAGFERIAHANEQWWNEYWRKSWIDFGKYADIQRYWAFGLYEIASVFGSVPMPGLNGLCYGPLDAVNPGVGTQGYTHDQNTQIPVMAFMPSNHWEFINVLADTYLSCMDELKRHTRELFDCPGICLPLNTNQIGMENTTLSYRYTLCGSAYTGLVLSWAWKYSRSVELLKNKIVPLLREFADFYRSIMPVGADGKRHLDWSVPPEIFTVTKDDSATISMHKVCLETLVEAAQILGLDGRLWEDDLKRIPSPAMHPDGGWWGGPDVPNNHYFFGGHQLYPFFPSEAYTDLKIARATLEHIDKKGYERSYSYKDGNFIYAHEWSAFLTTAARMRLGLREEAWAWLGRYIELFGKPNGLFSHDPIVILPTDVTEENCKNVPVNTFVNALGNEFTRSDGDYSHASPNTNAKRLAPPVLEGSSAFVFLATEALLQSWGGEIRLFPDVPDDFTGAFHKLLAQGGFEVSASMGNGKLTQFEITSIAGGKAAVTMPDGNSINIELQKGETFTKIF